MLSEVIMLSEKRSEKDKYFHFIYMWSLKTKQTQQNRNRIIDTKNK